MRLFHEINASLNGSMFALLFSLGKKNTYKLLLLCTENAPDVRPVNVQKTAINKTIVQILYQSYVNRLLISDPNTGPGVRWRTIQTSTVSGRCPLMNIFVALG
jgi:hypothetical protein